MRNYIIEVYIEGRSPVKVLCTDENPATAIMLLTALHINHIGASDEIICLDILHKDGESSVYLPRSKLMSLQVTPRLDDVILKQVKGNILRISKHPNARIALQGLFQLKFE